MSDTNFSKSVFAFDLDDTLAPSKSPLEPEMAEILSKLLLIKKVAVISGGTFEQFDKQFISQLQITSVQKKNLYLLPTSGTRLFVWGENKWHEAYADNISEEERDLIKKSLIYAFNQSGTASSEEIYGEQIEDRGSQITFSALGQNASLPAKRAWDPDRSKRQKIISVLGTTLDNYNVKIGGTTSIDVTKCNQDKASGIERFCKYLKMPKSSVLFFGDSMFPGGNDISVCEIGIDCVKVIDPNDTRERLENMLK
jgi:HAD superfamily hydrolase (TIGR01484 family)